MDELEIELVQGRNTALVDLFDPQHARKVLLEFGKAFSRLPDNVAEFHPAENLFLDRAIEGISEADEGKVISVRLALFAEMVKGRTWNLTTLDEIGGAEGVGATFLEEMFCSRSANPQHRLHEAGRGPCWKRCCRTRPATSRDIFVRIQTYWISRATEIIRGPSKS